MKDLLKGYETILNEENTRLEGLKNSLSEEEIVQLQSNSKLKEYLNNNDVVSLMVNNKALKELQVEDSIIKKLNIQDLVELKELNI